MSVRRFPVALLALLVSFGCERAQDETAERVIERILVANGRKAEVDIDREQGTISVSLLGAAIPENWPSEVPVYPGARRAKVKNPAPGRQRLSLESDDPVSSLARYYRMALRATGWGFRSGGASRSEIHARKGDRLLVARFTEGKRGVGSRARIELEKGA